MKNGKYDFNEFIINPHRYVPYHFLLIVKDQCNSFHKMREIINESVINWHQEKQIIRNYILIVSFQFKIQIIYKLILNDFILQTFQRKVSN